MVSLHISTQFEFEVDGGVTASAASAAPGTSSAAPSEHATRIINDDEPGLHADYKRWLEALAPFDASPSAATTTAPAKTTATPTTSAR